MFRQKALQEMNALKAGTEPRRAVVGFDGFVDTIVTAVGLRNGQGEKFVPIPTITDFGNRILGAAGKSTNIELFPRMEKLGGNGPIMANALLATGHGVTYIGALGRPAPHPVFAEFARKTRAVSLCEAAHTTAVEFDDGKVMLGTMKSLDEVTYDGICRAMGADRFKAELGAASLVALVNWTMIPNQTAIFRDIVAKVLPGLPASDRVYFFDLCDPEKRSAADLRDALTAIAAFGRFGKVTLGLNLKEAQQVHKALGFAAADEKESGLKKMASEIRSKLGLATVVVHPRESAASATADGTFWVPGPVAEKPLITTGAGDHFNAGFTTAQLLGLSPEACLALGVCTSGHYVRTAASPTLAELKTFLANWR